MQVRNRVFVADVPHSEDKREAETDLRSSSPELLFKRSEVSLSKPGADSRLSSTRRLLREARHKSGLLSHPHKRKPSKISCLQLCKRTFPNDVSSVRPVQRTVSFLSHQQVDRGFPANKGSKGTRVFRRFSASTSGPLCSENPVMLCGKSSKKSRLVRESEEVGSAGYKKCRVSRNQMGYRHEREKTSGRENSSNSGRFREGFAKRSMVLAFGDFSHRSSRFCSTGDSSRSFVHQIYSTRQSKTLAESPQPTPSLTTSGCQRLSLVDSQRRKVRKNFHPGTHHIYYNRRLQQGLGYPDQRLPPVWHMDKRASDVAHKQKGIVHRAHSSKRVPGCRGRPISYDSIRQQNSGLIPEKSRRNEVGGVIRGDQKDPFTSGESQCNHSFLLSTGPIQFHSRLFVEGEESPRLACCRRGHNKDILNMGCSPDRSICHQSIESSFNVRFNRGTRFTGSVHQRIQPDLALQAGMGLPSSAVNTQSTQTPQPVLRDLPSDGSPLGDSVLERRPEAESSGSSLPDSRCPQVYSRPVHRSPACEGRRVPFRGLENTGWSDLIADLDPGDIDLVQSAWRDSTWRTYESAWKQWVSWCNQNGRSPSSPRPQDVATYIGYLSRVRKLASSTILVHKSVILTLADPTQEKRLAGHPLVLAIIKAISLRRCASAPSKSQIWNVQDLLRWLKSHTPSENSIFQVSRHVALLLLLASGRRIHDLTLLSIDDEHCDRSRSSITFWPRFGSKTDNIKNRQSGWQLTCSGDSDLSLVKWVNLLIEVSAGRRGARSNLHSLFITTRGEVKAASRAVIAGWLKAPFRDLGIKCSPGSIRSAVASNDYQNNMPLDSILKRGNWKGSENFFKHYCKSVDHPKSGNSNVLNNSFSAV